MDKIQKQSACPRKRLQLLMQAVETGTPKRRRKPADLLAPAAPARSGMPPGMPPGAGGGPPMGPGGPGPVPQGMEPMAMAAWGMKEATDCAPPVSLYL